MPMGTYPGHYGTTVDPDCTVFSQTITTQKLETNSSLQGLPTKPWPEEAIRLSYLSIFEVPILPSVMADWDGMSMAFSFKL